MIFVCGDTHGLHDIKKLSSGCWPEGRGLTKDDTLVILGDSGINWSNNPEDREDAYLRNWLEMKGWTTLDVLGNHHNYDRLGTEELVDLHGGKAYRISDHIFAMQRGTIVEIEGLKIFSMGGGFSIDKAHRRQHLSWWPEEIPSFTEMKAAKENLEKVGNKVDLIFTHTCSEKTFHKMTAMFPGEFNHKIKGEEPLREFFDWVEDNVSFKQWHFGHLHVDTSIDEKHRCHYNNPPLLIENL